MEQHTKPVLNPYFLDRTYTQNNGFIMIMENMDVDLSLVKKERMELDEDYGNILDNFNAENEYDDFPNTTPIVSTQIFRCFKRVICKDL